MGAYCGTRYISSMNPGDACSGGGVATATKAGASEDTVTPAAAQYNQNSTPVQMGNESEAYYSAGRGGPAVPNMTKVYLAKEYFNKIAGLGSIKGAKPADVKAYSDLVSALRVYTGSKLGTRGAAETAWGDALKDASLAEVDVFSLISGGKGASSPFGSGSVGAYKGPVTTVTHDNEADMRLVADQLGSQILGRAVTDAEFKTALSKVRKVETSNPSVAGAGTAYQTNVSGLSEASRQSVIQRALLKQNGAEDFTLATKMMGLYQQALKEQPNATN